jgi:RNA polymerase sigma-70 factor (ECF subfamily)
MVESFETYQPYLFAIAYRMLGSAMDAEDMVQETWVRYHATPKDAIRSLKAFLTTVITRLCVDQLHLARRQREEYLGPWLPEPIGAAQTLRVVNPEERVDMDESISLAFLTLLEQLRPIERAVFLLREVFEYDYAEIATILDKSEAACRQSFSRAKKHLADHRPRFPASPDAHRQLLTGFYQAVQGGDIGALTHLLTEEVTFWADGGGKAKGVATYPMSGRAAVAAFILESSPVFRSTLPENVRGEFTQVNGQPALVVRTDERIYSVLTIDVQDGRIQTIRFMANPEKLTHV